jgi:hypothetical protein
MIDARSDRDYNKQDVRSLDIVVRLVIYTTRIVLTLLSASDKGQVFSVLIILQSFDVIVSSWRLLDEMDYLCHRITRGAFRYCSNSSSWTN